MKVEVFTLAQGYDVIAGVEDHGENEVYLKWANPMVITRRQNPDGRVQTSLSPMLNFTDDEEVVPNMGQVLFSATASKSVTTQYNDTVGKHKAAKSTIVRPSQSDVHKAGASRIIT